MKPGDQMIYNGAVKSLQGQPVLVIVVNDPKVVIGKPVGIVFKQKISTLTRSEPLSYPGHECDGAGPMGYCDWVRSDQLVTKDEWTRILKSREALADAKTPAMQAQIDDWLKGQAK